MRKMMIGIAAILALALAVPQVWAWYGGRHGGNYGNWNCPLAGGDVEGVDAAAYQKFLNDTKALRSDLAAKQGEYAALMNQQNPDPKAVGQAARELADIHEQLAARASSAGISAANCPMGGYGMGHMARHGGGYGHHGGQGMGGYGHKGGCRR